jgi:prepilin-type processing-associated H-X9-DG protein
MPDGKIQLKSDGKTVIDAMAACVVLALLTCLVMPALSKERDDARIAECADHLKQLGQAAHQYAADFDGKFFYNRSKKSDHKGLYKPELTGFWYDRERIGRYLEGELMYAAARSRPHPLPPEELPDDPPADWPHAGMGGGVFVCPSDTENSGRSYEMNYWAGNGYSLHPNETLPWTNGELFDSQSPDLDRLLLFTDVLGFKLTAKGWVCGDRLGNQMLPGQRFGGVEERFYGPDIFDRYGEVRVFHTLLDYVRHGTNRDRNIPLGAVNIGYADGHVGLRRSDQLFDSVSNLSTYDTLWSPVDQVIEEERRR